MHPLEGLTDFVDINAVVNPWQAMVVVVGIFALLIWPSMSARQSVKRVEKTLTENNGGSSVKDANDRIEASLAELRETQVSHGKALTEHVEWSEGYVKDTAQRLKTLEDCGSPRRRRWFS
jgi:cytoskeletal protein RodZ